MLKLINFFIHITKQIMKKNDKEMYDEIYDAIDHKLKQPTSIIYYL